jgi:hypothetical protein
MSFGFNERNPVVKAALRKARDTSIVFAAMSNEGGFKRAAWPARDEDLAIGIHSSNEEGTEGSRFTPRAVDGCRNFMVVGEEIFTHWPSAKGGGFRGCSGTSFATPVAVAMAALILAFVHQRRPKEERDEYSRISEELREISGMKKVLRRISNQSKDGYLWINPELLWGGFNPEIDRDPQAYARRLLLRALDD